MSVKIGHSCNDENGKAHGGQAGDQTSKEVCTRSWYDAKWHTVLRPIRCEVAKNMATACEGGCSNKNIGYDQYQRNTLRTQAKKVGFDLSKITVPCECDCSSFMSVCAECAGIAIPYDGTNAPTTRTMVKAFESTGEFKVLQDKKYLESDEYLLMGDILVCNGHTVMVLEDGGKAVKDIVVGSISYSGEHDATYTTTSDLNLRMGVGTSSGKVAVIPKNTKVRCYGYFGLNGNTKWLMVHYKEYIGFCSSIYLK